MFLVQRYNGSELFAGLEDCEQQIAITPIARRSASSALLGPETRRRTPRRGRDRDVTKLTRQLVKPPEALTRIDPPQLVVRELRQEKLVLGGRAPKPRAHVVVLAGVADLSEHSRIEEQPHREDLS